jgi:ankyrin repeat protein
MFHEANANNKKPESGKRACTSDRKDEMNAPNTTHKKSVHVAAENGQIEDILELYAAGADMNALRQDDGARPIHLAAANGHAKVIRALYESEVNMNALATRHQTAAHIAAANGYVEVIHALYESGADMNALDINGWTPAHTAAANGYVQVIHALYESGADMNVCDAGTRMPVHIAAESGHAGAIEALYAAGADLNADSEVGTPAHIAAEDGRPEIIKALLNTNAHMDLESWDGWTPFQKAAANGHVEIMRLLKVSIANIKSIDMPVEGHKPIYWAAANGHVRAVHLLQEAGVILEASTSGSWALDGAVQKGHADVISLFHAASLDMNVSDSGGITLIHLAAQKGHIKVIRALHAAGANINARDAHDRTPVYHAACNNRDSAILTLYALGANVDTPASRLFGCETPLYRALRQSRCEKAIKALLSVGADVNKAEERNGWTPIHLAASSGSLQLTRDLINRGADVRALDCNGAFPIELAAMRGNSQAIFALLGSKKYVINPLNSQEVIRALEIARVKEEKEHKKGHKEAVDLLETHFKKHFEKEMGDAISLLNQFHFSTPVSAHSHRIADGQLAVQKRQRQFK